MNDKNKISATSNSIKMSQSKPNLSNDINEKKISRGHSTRREDFEKLVKKFQRFIIKIYVIKTRFLEITHSHKRSVLMYDVWEYISKLKNHTQNWFLYWNFLCMGIKPILIPNEYVYCVWARVGIFVDRIVDKSTLSTNCQQKKLSRQFFTTKKNFWQQIFVDKKKIFYRQILEIFLFSLALSI